MAIIFEICATRSQQRLRIFVFENLCDRIDLKHIDLDNVLFVAQPIYSNFASRNRSATAFALIALHHLQIAMRSIHNAVAVAVAVHDYIDIFECHMHALRLRMTVEHMHGRRKAKQRKRTNRKQSTK